MKGQSRFSNVDPMDSYTFGLRSILGAFRRGTANVRQLPECDAPAAESLPMSGSGSLVHRTEGGGASWKQSAKQSL